MGTENASSDPDIRILTSSPALILRAGVLNLANPVNISTEDAVFSSESVFTRNLISVENISAGGPVILSAAGDVATRDINGGQISLESREGAVIVGGRLTSGSTINIQAVNNIILTNDITRGDINGNLTVNTTGGNIVTGAIDTGINGAIALTAAGNVNFGTLQGSQVNVTSNSGALGVLTDPNTIVPNKTPVNVTATENLTLAASGDLTVGDLRGATVSATSRNGSVVTGAIASTGGDVRILAGQEIISRAPITVNPAAANPVNPTIPTVNLDAQTNINVASVNAPTATIALRATNTLTAGILQGGAIDVSSTTGNITTANTASTGNINVRAAGNVNSGPLQGVAIDVNSRRGDVSTGNINAAEVVGILAGGQIRTGAIKVNVLGRDRTSTVNINAQNDIRIVSVNAPGGTVNIGTPGLVRVTGTFDQNGTPVSISTLGGNQPGSVVIRDGGRDRNPPIPFVEGDATTNGSAGAIGSTIPPTPPTPPTPPGTNPPPPSPSDRFPSDRGRVFPDRNQPLTPEQQQNQNSISRDIGKPGERMPPERMQSPRGMRNLIGSNLREPIFQSPFRSEIGRNLEAGNISAALSLLDKSFSQEFQEYFGLNTTDELLSPDEIKKKLVSVGAETGTKPSLIYLFSRSDKLDLMLVDSCGAVVHKTVPQANREELLKVVTTFRNEITKPGVRATTSYLPSAQQLYKWMVEPLEDNLTKCETDTISFVVDRGLRGMPFAALHDGKQFLVEKYNLSLMPSINLTDIRYVDIRKSEVLAMGASTFSELNPLPAVPAEIAAISREWPGVSFLNEGFTLENLKRQHQSRPFGIIHLATHGEFRPGAPSNSFIQLWDSRLRLNQLPDLSLNNPQVNLLVLSACRTAVGDESAELGFGGLALQAGVQTALGSLWYVSDEGTLGLMNEFYQHLKTAPVKAAALRQAQIAMLRGDVRLEGGKLRGSSRGEVDLPQSLQGFADLKFSHPYYWSAFVMIGSPW